LINDKIQELRQAAGVSNKNDLEKLWCVIVGNEDLGNEISYAVASSKKRAKVVFREHVVAKESFIQQKFDFILALGYSDNIRKLNEITKSNGGASIRIAPFYITNEPNLMFLVGQDEIIKKFTGNVEKNNARFSILLEDETTGFIDVDLNIPFLPNFIKTIISPLFNISEVDLTTILISVPNKEDIGTLKKIAKSKKLFIKSLEEIKNNLKESK
jgi:hypothetical protein